MRRPIETEVMISLYQIRGMSVQEIAAAYRISPQAVYSRLWRSGAMHRDSRAMYHTDEEIVAAFIQAGSMMRAAESLGCQFYTVRDALTRAKLPIPAHGHRNLERRAKVLAAVALFRSKDVLWKDLADRLQMHPATLWAYRRRLGCLE